MYSRPTAENNPAGKQRNLDYSFSNLSVKKTKKTKHLWLRKRQFCREAAEHAADAPSLKLKHAHTNRKARQ